MIDFFIFSSALAAFAVSTYGYGRIIYKYVYATNEHYYAYCISLGLAVWIFIGGILNFLNLAYSFSLSLLFYSGLILSAAIFIKSRNKSFSKRLSVIFSVNPASAFKIESLLYFIPIISFVFLTITLIPSDAFNFHDDFHTYIQRPIRMLQTGTLGGDPFSLMGIDSLGSQAFFQAFIISLFPVDYLNGFDSIFCFTICLFLIIEISAKLKVDIVFTLISLLIFIFINPLLVNLSAVYSGSLMILALVFSSLLLIESLTQPFRKNLFLKIIPFSLFCASLISLKATYIVYCVLFFPLFFSLLCLFAQKRKEAIIACISAATLIIISVIPWVMVSWSKLQAVAYSTLFLSKSSSKILPERNSLSDIFIDKQLYGDVNFWDYNFIVLMLATVLLISIIRLIKNNMPEEISYNVLLFSISTSGILSYFILVFLFNNGGLPRYTFPVLISVTPVLLLILSRNSQNLFRENRLKIFQAAISISFMILMSLYFFSDSFLFRVKRYYTYRTPVSFEIDQRYIRYTKAVIDESSRYKKWMQHLQSKIQSNETILAWIAEPFYLDYERNKVFTIDKPLLLSSWLPYGGDAVFLETFLNTWGIRYIIWGYDQPGMYTPKEYSPMLASSIPQFQKIGRYGLYLIDALKKISAHSNIIFDDGSIVIFEIGRSENNY